MDLNFDFELHKESAYRDFNGTLKQKIEEKGHNTKKMRIINLSLQKSGKINVLIWFDKDNDVESFNIEEIVKNWPKRYQWGLNQPFDQFIDNWMEVERKMEISPLLVNRNTFGDNEEHEDIFKLDDLKK